MKNEKFLIVAAHPDDAEIGLGGTILKLKSQGHKVAIIDLTSGEPTPFGTEQKRKKEAQKAATRLKVDQRINLGLPNRYLFDTKEARLLLAEQIRLFKPDILLAPYTEDAHPDHQAASQITEAARFYAKFTKVDLKGKPHYPSYLFYYYCNHLKTIPKISFLIDISQHFTAKMKVLKCYKSQFIANPKNHFVFSYIEEQNKYLGKLISCNYAEALFSKEILKINDLSLLL